MLLVVALIGLVVPNGFFIYWIATGLDGWRDILSNYLALGFILDAFMAMIILAVYFSKRPIGKHGAGTFVLLSLIGGLGFSLPMFWWMNKREELARPVPA